MPDSIIGHYEIDKYSAGFLILKRVLDVLGEQNSLIHC